jgi:NitT/TauT family transport system ATP-binding protein
MLGWVTTPGGRVEMTVAGRQFLAAGIKTRKQLLNTTLRGLFVFDLIVQALKKSASGEVDEAVILDLLARAFPHEQPAQILRTVVAWARYAELFKYNSIRRVFHGLPLPAASASPNPR